MLVRISVAARILGVCIKTLRRWEKAGKLKATTRTAGKHRRYDTRFLTAWLAGNMKRKENTGKREKNGKGGQQEKLIPQRVLIYARVSSNKQKGDLVRQIETLEHYCRERGYVVSGIYRDTASGLNDRRPGLLRILREVMAGGIDRVVVTYPDRLARFGTNIIRQVMESHGTVMDCYGEKNITGGHGNTVGKDPHRELVDDVVALLTSFAGKLHRMRRGKGKKEENTGGKEPPFQRVDQTNSGVVFPAG